MWISAPKERFLRVLFCNSLVDSVFYGVFYGDNLINISVVKEIRISF
jgi:hypothetical protein